MTAWTIGKLARRTGIPASAVRYYERAGLVRPDGRTAGNYRLYGEATVQRLLFIRAAQTIGFKLADIRVLLEYQELPDDRCEDVQQLIRERLADVEHRLEHLERVCKVLRDCLNRCEQSGGEKRCPIITELTRAAGVVAPPPEEQRPG